MNTQDGASPRTHQVLTDHHQRCALALARLQALAAGDGAAVRDVERAIQQVIDEVRATEERILITLAGTDRVGHAARLLGGRLVRLADAAEDVNVALRAGNVSWLRRHLTRFDVLTRATCAIQLDVYRSALAAGRHPQRTASTPDAAGRR